MQSEDLSPKKDYFVGMYRTKSGDLALISGRSEVEGKVWYTGYFSFSEEKAFWDDFGNFYIRELNKYDLQDAIRGGEDL